MGPHSRALLVLREYLHVGQSTIWIRWNPLGPILTSLRNHELIAKPNGFKEQEVGNFLRHIDPSLFMIPYKEISSRVRLPGLCTTTFPLLTATAHSVSQSYGVAYYVSQTFILSPFSSHSRCWVSWYWVGLCLGRIIKPHLFLSFKPHSSNQH